MNLQLAAIFMGILLCFGAQGAEALSKNTASCTLEPVASFLEGATNTEYWQTDFENKTLDNWSYLLNPQGISIVPINETETEHAAKITIKGTEDFLWKGLDFLNRSEMQFKPAQVQAGQQTQLSWKFMVPELFSDKRHEIAYWESDTSYKQIMRFNLEGERFYFSDSKGTNKVDLVSVSKNTWYHVEMAITWSPLATLGRVSVCVDGTQYVSNIPIATLVEDESVFFQIGILRDRTDIVESILIDDVKIAVK